MLARDKAVIGFMAGIILLVFAWNDTRSIQSEAFSFGNGFSLVATIGLAITGITIISITFYSLAQGDDDEILDSPRDIAAHEVTVAVYDLMGTPLESEKDMSPELLRVISRILGERKPHTLDALERRSNYRSYLKRKEHPIPSV